MSINMMDMAKMVHVKKAILVYIFPFLKAIYYPVIKHG